MTKPRNRPLKPLLTAAKLTGVLKHLLVLVKAGLLEADRSPGQYGKRLTVLRRMMKTGNVDIEAIRKTLNYRLTKQGNEVAMAFLGVMAAISAGTVKVPQLEAETKRKPSRAAR